MTQQTLAGINTYLYDSANRLTSVDGITYTWDDNGNLLNDGVNTYTYDHANRLKSVNRASLSTSYVYNGLGDRLQQTVNGVQETYLLNTTGGLTQVLVDGTNTYLYGVVRIAQQHATGTQYFLGDALGSVRQIVNENGDVTLAKSYEPYGAILESAGGSTTSYGFTNEWMDRYTNLVYLRSQWYSPQLGRFISEDNWKGNHERPMSFNAWTYVQGNPINYSDPNGYWRWWTSNSLFHMPIEDYYEQGFGILNPNKQLEYPVPGTPFRHVDMFNSLFGDV